MKTGFTFSDGLLSPAAAGDDMDILLYVAPGEDDKREMIESLGIERRYLESALDADEISRAEFSPDRAFITWKRPKNVSVEAQLRFKVGSIGLFLKNEQLVVIVDEDPPSLTAGDIGRCSSPWNVMASLLDHTVHHYLGHLKVIKKITEELGAKITGSMENQYFLQMLALGESLIYYIDAIESNSGVLAKLQMQAYELQLSAQQIDRLRDLAFDNQQCARQARIYSEVISGLMDARGSVINNNVSILLKKLTLINIIFLPLNLIAGMGGMSEFSMMTHGIDWRFSYLVLSLGMALLAWASWYALVRLLEKRQPHK